MSDTKKFIPKKQETFFNETEEYKTMKVIIESGKFFPTWITGPKGSGKSSTVENICAELEREFIRVNFNQETDEMELLGTYNLINGDTVFTEGPVVEALRRGAVLLLDEVDVAHPNKILCLQSVLEGKGVFVKAKNEHVYPADGFQVFATSNTKGRGCDTGEYIGTNIMNGAFLDRFCVTIEQNYPTKKQELEILKQYWAEYVWIDNNIKREDLKDDDVSFMEDTLKTLIKWADHVRKCYDEGTLEEVISTRSLINIIKGVSIFNSAETAIKMCCNRYAESDAMALIEAYDKFVDPGVVNQDEDSIILEEFLDSEIE